MSVIDFQQAKQQRQPHWCGEVRCLGCGNEWEGVGPVGSISDLECPSCKLHKGVVKNLFGPDEGDAVLQCTDCGADVVTVYKRKNSGLKVARCVGCGLDLTDAFFG